MGDIGRTISIRGKWWSRLGDRVSVLASLEFERVSGVCLLCSCRWQMQQVASQRRQGHRRSTTTTTTTPAAAAASTTSDNAAFKTVFGNSFAFCLLCFCLCFFLSLFCQSGQFGEFFLSHVAHCLGFFLSSSSRRRVRLLLLLFLCSYFILGSPSCPYGAAERAMAVSSPPHLKREIYERNMRAPPSAQNNH